jgi:hypothetical protein
MQSAPRSAPEGTAGYPGRPMGFRCVLAFGANARLDGQVVDFDCERYVDFDRARRACGLQVVLHVSRGLHWWRSNGAAPARVGVLPRGTRREGESTGTRRSRCRPFTDVVAGDRRSILAVDVGRVPKNSMHPGLHFWSPRWSLSVSERRARPVILSWTFSLRLADRRCKAGSPDARGGARALTPSPVMTTSRSIERFASWANRAADRAGEALADPSSHHASSRQRQWLIPGRRIANCPMEQPP